MFNPKKEIEEKMERSEWELWQDWYQDHIQRNPPASPHEDTYSQILMAAATPKNAEYRLRKAESSMGVDLSADFKLMYAQTKHMRL